MDIGLLWRRLALRQVAGTDRAFRSSRSRNKKPGFPARLLAMVDTPNQNGHLAEVRIRLRGEEAASAPATPA